MTSAKIRLFSMELSISEEASCWWKQPLRNKWMCLPGSTIIYQTLQTKEKKEFWQTVRQTTTALHFSLLQVYPSVVPFVLTVSSTPFFGGGCRDWKFDKFCDTAPLGERVLLYNLYYDMRNFCNLIDLEQWCFSLIWNTYMWKLETFCG